MDDLSKNKCGTGCISDRVLTNHVMYADDLVMFPPYSAGLQLINDLLCI